MSRESPGLAPRDLDGILGYLQQHRVLHLATSGAEGPHSAPLFYALVGARLELTWISDPDTLHTRQLEASPLVSASVSASAPSPISVEGVQLRGQADTPDADQERLCDAYLARFPTTRALLAASRRHRFYRLRPRWVRWIRWTAGVKRSCEGSLDYS